MLNIKAKLISDSPASLDRLESALDRIETALAEREAEAARLRRVEVAAATALADLDALINTTDLNAAGPGPA